MESQKSISTETTRNFKVYSINTITIVAFFLGPVGACYMLAKNFEVFGDKAASKKTWMVLIVSIVIYSFYFIISQSTITIMDKSLPIIYTLIIYYRTNDLQGNMLDEHIKNGGKVYSGWKAFGVGISSLLILFVYLLVLALIFG